MMKVTNPTEQTVSIVIQGRQLSVAGLASIVLEDSVAKKWQSVHEFLVIEESMHRYVDQANELQVKPIAKEEPKVEVKAAPKAEEKKVAPKAAPKKGGKK
jgi:hypothetical protein